jgi:hypothetical protein
MTGAILVATVVTVTSCNVNVVNAQNTNMTPGDEQYALEHKRGKAPARATSTTLEHV